VDTDNPRASAAAGGRGGKAGDHLGLRDLRSRSLEAALSAGDQTDRMELRGRHPWRLGGGAISFHAALQVGHGAQSRRGVDAPFARIDRMGQDRFDIYWMRHTGKWWRLHAGVTFAEALRILETDSVLHPV